MWSGPEIGCSHLAPAVVAGGHSEHATGRTFQYSQEDTDTCPWHCTCHHLYMVGDTQLKRVKSIEERKNSKKHVVNMNISVTVFGFAFV